MSIGRIYRLRAIIHPIGTYRTGLPFGIEAERPQPRLNVMRCKDREVRRFDGPQPSNDGWFSGIYKPK